MDEILPKSADVPRPRTAAIALVFSDGTVGRMQFFDDPTDEKIQAAIDRSVFASGVPASWRRVKMEDFPSDHTFRAAWVDDGKEILIDKVKADAIMKQKKAAQNL